MGKLRVLVIDDSQVDYLRSHRILSELGHQTFHVNDGSKAIDGIKRFRPDCILLDIVMNNVDGFATLRILADAGISIPIIMLSTKDSLVDREYAQRFGASGYVSKPASRKSLEKAMEMACKVNTAT